MTTQDVRPPRSEGAVSLSAKRRGAVSALDGLRMSGCLKALFPRGPGLQAMLINSSGGLTGGDRIAVSADAGAGSRLTLTTQAAERAYRASSGTARVHTRLRAGPGAALHWLPQELIVFDGAALSRRLEVDVAADARLLLCEAIVFGRTAMGERVSRARLSDRVSVDRAGRPLWRDALALCGDVAERLARPGVAGGGVAVASVLYVSPDAEAQTAALRGALPPTCGASLVAHDVLALRLVARDGQALRRTLLPVLDRLSGGRLPVSWSL